MRTAPNLSENMRALNWLASWNTGIKKVVSVASKPLRYLTITRNMYLASPAETRRCTQVKVARWKKRHVLLQILFGIVTADRDRCT